MDPDKKFGDLMEKSIELALKASELRYRRLFEAAQDGILILDAETGLIEDVNPYLVRMLGFSREEFVEKKLWEVGAFRDIEANQDAFKALQEDEYIRYANLPLKAKDGRLLQVEFVSNVYLVGKKKVIQCNIRDNTAHKKAEENLQDSEERFRWLIEHLPTVVYLTAKGHSHGMRFVSQPIVDLLGYSVEEWLADLNLWPNSLHPDDRQRVLEKATDSEKDNLPFEMEYRMIARDGRLVWVHDQTTSGNGLNGGRQLRQGIMLDITERKQSEEKIRRQLEHLTALGVIDRIIAANFDLYLCLSEILVHVTKELKVDAADILILNSNSHMLEFGAESGFYSKAVRKAQIRLGENFAGQVALERRLIQIPNLRNEMGNLNMPALLSGEDFSCYYGVPLISKGQVKGVLEVFHRIALNPDAEWFDFLNALAGQVAIAIENVSLFESLQRSNLELTLAYDATIKGWSHALDLRDKETEGHTQRVTEMTVKLARAIGFNEEELVQVRWGALLHDIGKLGVPDGILLKPGPLTDEEWVIMKMHPALAYEMLSPIRYLHSALDIPYSHHEKWDGTGYPNGLEGIQIPLIARIFAVVDVWDALRSDRPYRAAWPEEKVYQYIRSLSGTHFDPQVVEKFMQVTQ